MIIRSRNHLVQQKKGAASANPSPGIRIPGHPRVPGISIPALGGRRGAQGSQGTLGAVGFAGHAVGSAVEYQQVAQKGPVLLREQVHRRPSSDGAQITRYTPHPSGATVNVNCAALPSQLLGTTVSAVAVSCSVVMVPFTPRRSACRVTAGVTAFLALFPIKKKA